MGVKITYTATCDWCEEQVKVEAELYPVLFEIRVRGPHGIYKDLLCPECQAKFEEFVSKQRVA
jgi:hypothetical protein